MADGLRRDTPARHVVELRVHGVGGGSASELLGTSDDDVVQVAGTTGTSFWARRGDLGVEGYWWGKLTSGPLLQPFWVLLLPFTLVNAAGWAVATDGRRWRAALERLLVIVLAFCLTAGYVLGASAVVVRDLFVEWGGENWSRLEDARDAMLAGVVVMLALFAFVAYVALRVQRNFERVEGPTASDRRSRVTENARPVDFRDRDFWARSTATRRLLALHGVVALATIAIVVARAWNAPTDELELRGLFTLLGWVQLGALLALFVSCALRGRAYFSEHRFRYCAPVVMVVLALAVQSALFSGASALLEKALKLERRAGWDAAPERALDVAFGAAVVALVVAALVVVFLAWRRSREEAAGLRLDAATPPPGHEPEVLPLDVVVRTARARQSAWVIRYGELALTAAALVFAAVALHALLGMASVEPYAAVPETAAAMDESRVLAALGRLGPWLAAALAGWLLVGAVRNYFKSAHRRTVGQIWDVLTIWPRRFHPLAVRPYAERAVPELQARLCWHLDASRHPCGTPHPVVLCAHSQGSVIAFAALRQMAAFDGSRGLLRDVALVTYGSPLQQLHARVFPSCFGAEAYAMVADSMTPLEVGWDGDDAPAGWRHFSRDTDPLRQRLEFGDPEESERRYTNVPDPATGPLWGTSEPGDAAPLAPDAPRAAWVNLAGHSHYHSEPALQSWIAAVAGALAAPPGGP